MKRTPLQALIGIVSVALGIASTQAEDIDLYAGLGSNATVPNVLFVLDNAADFDASAPALTCSYADGSGAPSMSGSLAGIEQCALFNAVYSLPAGVINIGLMGYNANQFTGYSCASGGVGGCLLQPLQFMDAAHKANFGNWVKGWALSPSDPNSVKANSESVGGVMQESWAYYAGQTGLSGRTYAGIQPTPGCQKNFVIFIGNAFGSNGKPSDGSSASPSAALQSAPGVTASQLVPINVPYAQGLACNTKNPYYGMPNHTDSSGLWADEWARYMYQADIYSTLDAKQSITTYAIGMLGAQCKPDFPALMTSMAKVGGGKYFNAYTYSELYQAIMQILNEVQAINSVFASASLPVSVNSQGTYNNQVFMGMFRPDPNGLVRWAGNLKQYQFGVDTTDPKNVQLFLADATGAQAISSAGTGFISPNARSYWTNKDTSRLPDATPPGGFWVNNPQGVGVSFDSVDGEIVEKGGVSQQLRLANLTTDYVATPTAPRKMYTCIGTNCTAGGSLSNMPFATTNSSLTETALGITNPIYNAVVSSITRDSASQTVTVTLASAPSPAITLPTSAAITGSQNGQFDGSLAALSPSASGSTVTYTLATAIPTTPASPSNPTTYTVSGTSALLSPVTSITRGSGAGLITATAVLNDLTFGGGAVVAVGDGVTISNSSGYNITATVLTVNTSTKAITFKLMDSPSTVGGDNNLGSNFYIGASCTTSGSNPNCDNISQTSNTPPGLIRGTNCTTCTGVSSTDQVLMINFAGGSNKINPAVGNIAKLQNMTPTNYNNTTTGYQVVGLGSNCRVSYTNSSGAVQSYVGTPTGSKVFTVCLALGSSFALTPSLTANGALAGTTATRPNAGLTRQIKTLTRGAGNCVNGVGNATATATATTMTAHGFSSGATVTIATATPVDNETNYTGSNIAITVTATDTFTYTIPILPKCSDTTAGMRIYYQTSTGGISATDLIRWTRGADIAGDELGPGSGVTVRPSIHGDVLHSRPVVVNYGGSTGVVVFYGANDGAFHAVNGNQSGSIGSAAPGAELWSFIPTEFFPKLQRMFRNSPVMHLFTTMAGLSPTPTPKEYFFDGIAGVYQHFTTGGATDKAYIFLSARRGGRLLYALDVTNPNDPKFLWKKGCPNLTDNTGCDAGFAELGQTWSQPKAAMLKGYKDGSGNAKPVVILGAGYYGGYLSSSDTYYGEDASPPTANNLMGRGIFILDGETGCILWQAGPNPSTSGLCSGGATTVQSGMTYAIAADVTVLNRDYDKYGYIDRAYAADVGGNIWRIDFEPASGNGPSNWQVTKFASLGGSDTTKRKFLYAPDVVSTKSYDIVIAATGDREHPLYANTLTYGVVNKFYALYDTKTGMDASGWTAIVDNTSSSSTSAPAYLFNSTSATVPKDNWQNKNGFFFSFQNTGERGVNAPTTIGGFAYFGTSQPTVPGSPNSCKTVLGTARGYAVNILQGTNQNGLPSATNPVEFAGGGLAPSPIAGLVNVNVNGTNSIQPFIIGAGGVPGQGGSSATPGCNGPDCTSAIGALRPPIPVANTRRRIYWYLDKHDN